MSLESRVQETFQHLHTHAEIGWEETETTNYIASILKRAGCSITTFEDSTGVIGEYGDFNQGLPVVAFRADIDALWQEVDGKFQANHSCGHDAHMSIVLGLLWRLTENASLKNKVAIKFIFQPAEELGSGALTMIEKEVVDNVDYLFGIHLRPQEEMDMGQASPVIVHGAMTTYEAKIIGEDAHAARPHLNINAIEVIGSILHMLGHIHLNPRIPHSVKMTNIQSGGKSTNIIPGRASFAIDMRAQNNDAMDTLEHKVENVFRAVSNLYGVDINITNIEKVPAAKTNKVAIEVMEKAISTVLGEENITPPLVTPGGDDFHFYTIKRPALKATMLGLGCNLKPGLHHPYMTFNKEALIVGVDILYEAMKEVYEIV